MRGPGLGAAQVALLGRGRGCKHESVEGEGGRRGAIRSPWLEFGETWRGRRGRWSVPGICDRRKERQKESSRQIGRGGGRSPEVGEWAATHGLFPSGKTKTFFKVSTMLMLLLPATVALAAACLTALRERTAARCISCRKRGKPSGGDAEAQLRRAWKFRGSAGEGGGGSQENAGISAVKLPPTRVLPTRGSRQEAEQGA